MRPASVGAREDVHLIAQGGRQPSGRLGGGADAGVGTRVVEPDVMLVGRRRRVRSNDRQSVLAVLQQGSPRQRHETLSGDSLDETTAVVRDQWRRSTILFDVAIPWRTNAPWYEMYVTRDSYCLTSPPPSSHR